MSRHPPSQRPNIEDKIAEKEPDYEVSTPRPRAVFYVRIRDIRLLDLIEFYSEDIRVLEELGYEVVKTNSALKAIQCEGDLLFAWWWHTSVLVALHWRLRRRPVVITGAVGVFEPVTTGRVRQTLKLLATICATHLATANVAISKAELAKLEVLRAPRRATIELAVDTNFYSPGFQSPTPTAIVVAQLFPISIVRKGVDTAIRSVEQVRRSVPDFKLILVGPLSSEGSAKLDELRAECNFDAIEVTGEVSRSEKSRLMSSAWFILQPSVYEGFGLSVLEGMASGCVPICSNAGGLPEVVGDAGTILKERSTKSLADAVVALVKDPVKRDELGNRARRRSLTFDRTVHIRKYADVLTGLRLPNRVVGPENRYDGAEVENKRVPNEH